VWLDALSDRTRTAHKTPAHVSRRESWQAKTVPVGRSNPAAAAAPNGVTERGEPASLIRREAGLEQPVPGPLPPHRHFDSSGPATGRNYIVPLFRGVAPFLVRSLALLVRRAQRRLSLRGQRILP
jgi:hypothetical protein